MFSGAFSLKPTETWGCLGIEKVLAVYGHFKPLTLYHTIPTFNDPVEEAFENILGKEENAGKQQFLLFPKCFLPIQKKF